MPIKVHCHCGANFSAKDELAGQTLLCPKCSQPLTIGAEAHAARRPSGAGGIADLFDEVGIQEVKGPRCPQCGGALQSGAVLCVNCGFHLQTGEKISGVNVRGKGERGHSEASDVLLERAAHRIAEEKMEDKKNRSQGMPAWFYFICLGLVVAFCITMFFLPRNVVIFAGGMFLIGVAVVVDLVAYFYLVAVAFNKGTVQGMMFLFLPGYQLYFAAVNAEEAGGMFWFAAQMTGILVTIGGTMVGLSFLVSDEEEAQGRLPRACEVRVVELASAGALPDVADQAVRQPAARCVAPRVVPASSPRPVVTLPVTVHEPGWGSFLGGIPLPC